MLRRNIAISIALWGLQARPSFSQDYSAQRSTIFVSNILLNGLIGGIGGAINKDDSQTILKAFGKNFLAGCLGGSIRYLAKYDTYNVHYDRQLVTQKFSTTAWGNRFLYFAGHSIVTNASLNKTFWDTYQVNLYGVNLAYSFKEKQLKPRVSLNTLGTLIYFGLEGHKIDFGNSLSYGLYYFKMNENENVNIATGGYNAIVIDQNYWKLEHVISHEYVHGWQMVDYFPINSFFEKSFSGLRQRTLFKQLDKWIIFDFPYMGLFYVMQPKPWLYKNFYEFEAEHFGTRKYVER